MKRKFWLVPLLLASLVLSPFVNGLVGPVPEVSAASIGTVTENDSIYQIMVDRFHDGDPSNNATGAAIRYGETSEEDFRHMKGGDWQGVIDKLPYIKGMGYTAIWISPVAEPQMTNRENNGTGRNTAYHGYNVKDPNKANPYFGTKEKLKELVDSAHALGIKVIIDVVPNHVGDYMLGPQNFYDIPSLQPAAPFNNPSWYHHNGDINWSLVDGRYDQWAQDYIENHDLAGLDDIDFDVPAAKQAMFDSIKGWFDYTGADGARVDAAKLMKPTDIGELEDYLGVNTFGENFDGNPEFVSRWIGEGKEWGMLDFPLFFSILNSFGYGQSFDANIKSTLAQDHYYGGRANHMVTFIDNHDRNRFLTEAGGSVQKLQNALTFLFTVRGTPVVFQGTEQNKGNANGQIIGGGIADTWNRWSMVKRDANGNVLENYFNTNTDTYQYVAKLNEIRQQHQALRTGTQREMWSAQNLYAFSRRVDTGSAAGQEVISVFSNAPGGTQSVTIPLRIESTLPVGTVLANQLNPSDTVTVQAGGVTGKQIAVSVGANSAKIYAQQQPAGPDTTAPSIPGNVAAAAVSPTSVSVTWSPSTDNVGVAGYYVYRDGVQVGQTASASYTDTGLTAETSYSYTVKAYDAAGNISLASAAAVALTPSSSGSAIIYYRNTAYTNAYMHYKLDNASTWTAVPGAQMTPSSAHPGYFAITVPLNGASGLTAAFNNGSGSWDNNGSQNYHFGIGTWTLANGTIVSGEPQPEPDGVTFQVTVPSSTPANGPVYLAGTFNNWNPADPAYQLTKGSNGQYSITFNLPAGTAVQYKLTRGSWATVEVQSGGGDISNRTLTPTGGPQPVAVTVQRWKDQ